MCGTTKSQVGVLSMGVMHATKASDEVDHAHGRGQSA